MSDNLEFLFNPRSIALVGISATNPDHWTHSLLDGLLKMEFPDPIYPVNFKGGEMHGLKVYPSIRDIPGDVDYVIGLVPAASATELVEDCAGKGVRAIHFCTAGFSETGEEEGARMEGELTEAARKSGIRVIGPNCMGLYCPGSHLSFSPYFPSQSGSIALISQSGGIGTSVIRQAAPRGLRFSKAISYGNACDLNECDYLEYLADDSDTRIIAMYVEGTKDGEKFRRALEKAAQEKILVLLKGGVTEGGSRAAAGHTGAMAGSETAWDALCKQHGIIRVHSIVEMLDVLVALEFMPPPGGKNAACIGAGGGASVLISDAFEKHGLKVPHLPESVISRIREFTPIAGNIFKNPIDYGQNMSEFDKFSKTIEIVSQWDGVDFVVKFIIPSMGVRPMTIDPAQAKMVARLFISSGQSSKPVVMVIEPNASPQDMERVATLQEECISAGRALYHSFEAAANAINVVADYNEKYPGKLSSA